MIDRNFYRAFEVLLSPILIRLMHFVRGHPILNAWALAFVCRYPMLEARLYQFALARGIIAGGMIVQITEPSRLTPNARRIYTDLKTAIERHNNEEGY